MLKKKEKEEDFFKDILNNDNLNDNDNDNNDDDNNEILDFDFEIPIIEEKKEEEISLKTKRNKTEIQESVEVLQGNINSMLKTIDIKPDDFFPDADLLPKLEIEIELHDYEKDIELIKIDSKETLECLANLYLTEEQMKTKNIYKIIKDDSLSLSKLNFSIEQSQRALISCMKQLDLGINDPEMYQAVAMFQKEMRDTIKLTYEIQRKMKDFYKELKSELQELNAGENEKIKVDDEDNYTIIGDPKMLNDLFEKMKKDPTLIQDMMKNDDKNQKK
jgi:hypothetical protein